MFQVLQQNFSCLKHNSKNYLKYQLSWNQILADSMKVFLLTSMDLGSFLRLSLHTKNTYTVTITFLQYRKGVQVVRSDA